MPRNRFSYGTRNAKIREPSIAKALLCDKPKANCRQTLAKTIARNRHQPRGFMLQSRWPAAKLGILGHSKLKLTCLASTYPSVRRGKHVRLSRSSTHLFLIYSFNIQRTALVGKLKKLQLAWRIHLYMVITLCLWWQSVRHISRISKQMLSFFPAASGRLITLRIVAACEVLLLEKKLTLGMPCDEVNTQRPPTTPIVSSANSTDWFERKTSLHSRRRQLSISRRIHCLRRIQLTHNRTRLPSCTHDGFATTQSSGRPRTLWRHQHCRPRPQ